MEPNIQSPSVDLKRKQQASEEEEFVLEDMYEDANFDFDLKDVHSSATSMLQRFVKKEIIKASLRKHVEKAKNVKQTLMLKKNSLTRQNLKQTLKEKQARLEEKLRAPPFVRTQDKAAFTIGIILLCLTEYFLLKRPESMATWYTTLIVPLLITRYFSYHKLKYHYFMLDFCYYVQILLLANIFFVKDPRYFQIVFAVSNGPLCVAIVMWRNSLVFHDLDKLTSVFIHIFPPIVTFCMRWFPENQDLSNICVEKDCYMSPYYAIVLPFVFYILWQLLYLIKTEVFDREKLARDKEIMTSVRWMTQVKPHPIYKMMLKAGLRPNPVLALSVVQGIYTLFTLLPVLVIYNHYELHCVYLCGIFVICIWNGANFYFEIFSETYSARLQGYLKEMKEVQAPDTLNKLRSEECEKDRMDSDAEPSNVSTPSATN